MAEIIQFGDPKKLKTKNQEQLRAITDAVISLVTESGFAALTLRDVADRAGVSMADVQPFADKHKLLETTLDYGYFRYIEMVNRDELAEYPVKERAQMFVSLAWRYYQSDYYLGVLEILLSTRSVRDYEPLTLQIAELWESYLILIRTIFPECQLDDRELTEVLTMLHSFQSGLSIQTVMYPKTSNIGGYLRRITRAFTDMLESQ